eukprot:gb/GFBE01035935.1/.p1 GENE.gb/GFBE01035935.1/~~gb/GFBE01035935.1/.p1  ORF type:complete len:235 (+),score=28.39 gb/GFBE01035935.1/:1-705(+)
MARFGKPPDPAKQPHFPGISARNFDPASAAVCYLQNIKKENNARCAAHEVERTGPPVAARARLADTFSDHLPGLMGISSVYTSRGWSQSLNTGRWLPPGADTEMQQSQSESCLSSVQQAPTQKPFRSSSIGGLGTLVTRPAQVVIEPPRPPPDAAATPSPPEFYSSWRAPKRGTWQSHAERDLGTTSSRLTNLQSQTKIAELVRRRCGGQEKRPRRTAEDTAEQVDFAPRITWC